MEENIFYMMAKNLPNLVKKQVTYRLKNLNNLIQKFNSSANHNQPAENQRWRKMSENRKGKKNTLHYIQKNKTHYIQENNNTNENWLFSEKILEPVHNEIMYLSAERKKYQCWILYPEKILQKECKINTFSYKIIENSLD